MRLGFRLIAGVVLMIVASIASFVSKIGLVEVDAQVSSIDRKCTFVEKDKDAGSERSYEDNCDSTGEWDAVKADKSKQNIVGSADVLISYTSPKDQSYQTAHLHYSARDPEFFSVKAYDTIKVLVDPDHPEKVRKAS